MGQVSQRTPPQGRKRNLKLTLAIALDPRTQQNIAFAADLYPEQLSKIKLGHSRPTPAQMEAIAAALEMAVADLFETDQVAS